MRKPHPEPSTQEKSDVSDEIRTHDDIARFIAQLKLPDEPVEPFKLPSSQIEFDQFLAAKQPQSKTTENIENSQNSEIKDDAMETTDNESTMTPLTETTTTVLDSSSSEFEEESQES